GVRDVVGRDPRLCLRLEATDDEAADLLLEVGVAVRVAEHRQVGGQPIHPVGHHVEVLGGVQGHADTCERTDLLGPLPGTVDDHLGLDVAGVRAHTAHPAVAHVDAYDPGPLEDPRAALPCAAGQRSRQVGRVRLAVAGQPDGAYQV